MKRRIRAFLLRHRCNPVCQTLRLQPIQSEQLATTPQVRSHSKLKQLSRAKARTPGLSNRFESPSRVQKTFSPPRSSSYDSMSDSNRGVFLSPAASETRAVSSTLSCRSRGSISKSNVAQAHRQIQRANSIGESAEHKDSSPLASKHISTSQTRDNSYGHAQNMNGLHKSSIAFGSPIDDQECVTKLVDNVRGTPRHHSPQLSNFDEELMDKIMSEI